MVFPQYLELLEKFYRNDGQIPIEIHYCSFFCTTAVFQNRARPPAQGRLIRLWRADNRFSPSCRTGLFPATWEFLNFSNQTIIKGDTAIFVRQCRNHVFFSTFSYDLTSLHFCLKCVGRQFFVWADNFRR